MAVDPVCGKEVLPHNAEWMIWYRDTPYYFCSEPCHVKFDRNPAKYRERALAQRESEAIY